ncbi:MAG: ATP-dependent zinc metalloprotease FtsH [Chloroflexi bacterium]|nr:MAG: ATP-dependent zinc metalloprotease FtsH [Chloroflexota bacterium]MBL1194989.1 ATP-dependent zinc metalloprotease FtsH [Chloroflexota bacterium]NOH12277.1 ATP-dependent zinc metalloprotease FtsH [Chloroflexota bacterium]
MNDKQTGKRRKFSVWYILIGILGLSLLMQIVIGPLLNKRVEISYSEFKQVLRAGELTAVTISEDLILGEFTDETMFETVRVEDPDLINELETQEIAITGMVQNNDGISSILGWILPLVIMFAFWYWMMGRAKKSGGLGGGLFNFGKTKARVVQGEQSGVTFKDVGGADQAVVELKEVTQFLQNPTQFQRLGGKMPKGVILVGPPGTGKTLLARASAGEAGVPFYSLSGSEFVEMYVGVGASRVRDLFDQAKKSAPSIIFIDELDAIGGRRGGTGTYTSHEEREQTLNQLLAEMDGFESTPGVIVLAATNRPEVLDPALLRPGRFDRQITVDLPDLVGRRQILSIHSRDVQLAADVDIETVARITPGFSGADLENVVNQAALLAARRDKVAVEIEDFDDAIERVVAGSERRTLAMNEIEKRMVAVHESGHALVASLLPGADPVHKVSIVPRGRALGYTLQRPVEDRYLLGEDELHLRLAVLLGGRVAEALVFGEISTGAADDLAQATDLARRMVTEYGMSPELGPVRLAADPGAFYLGQLQGLDARVSPQTAALVDAETQRIIEKAVTKTWQLLDAYRPALDQMAEQLCEQETLDATEVDSILEAFMPWDEINEGNSRVANMA